MRLIIQAHKSTGNIEEVCGSWSKDRKKNIKNFPGEKKREKKYCMSRLV